MGCPGLRRGDRHLVRRRQHPIPALSLRGRGAPGFHLHLRGPRRPDGIPQHGGLQISRAGRGGSLQRDDHHWRHWDVGMEVVEQLCRVMGISTNGTPKKIWQSVFTHQLLTLICFFFFASANSHMRSTQLQSLPALVLS